LVPFLGVIFAIPVAGVTRADLVTFTPDTIADFQANGTIVAQIDGGVASSTLSDPTSESPNVFTAQNSISQPGQVSYTHDLQGATFDPATTGLITGIRFSIDVRDPGAASNDTAIHFGVRQGGNLYYFTETGTNRFAFRNPNSTSFLSFDKQGIDAGDFAYFPGGTDTVIQGSVNPDFSLGGDSLQFLVGTASGTGGSNPIRISEFRNVRVEINYAAIPEPSPVLLFSVIGCLLLPNRTRGWWRSDAL
jgi:hypothetical protein